MAVEKLNIDRFLEFSQNHLIIDVRSPGEYNHAHIPGAINIPLFTDEERKIVGTTYKQKSREDAIKVGLEFFAPKMKSLVEEAERIYELRIRNYDMNDEIVNRKSPPDRVIRAGKIVNIYCWRGGMRSAGVAWLLDLYGFQVYTLAGGYKKFRNYVLDTFKLPFHFRILGGYTGSGKTETLNALQEKGEKVIDLEKLACHKGSAFGNIGMPAQPSQEMFENLLSLELQAASFKPNSHVSRFTSHEQLSTSPIWLEDESQRLGHVNIPNDLWKTMRKSPIYFLDIPFEERLRHITEEYGQLDKQKMLDAIDRIREKLGGLNAKLAAQLLNEGNTLESFRILLEYYDRAYFRSMHNRESLNSLLNSIESMSITPENANLLIRHPKPAFEKI